MNFFFPLFSLQPNGGVIDLQSGSLWYCFYCLPVVSTGSGEFYFIFLKFFLWFLNSGLVGCSYGGEASALYETPTLRRWCPQQAPNVNLFLSKPNSCFFALSDSTLQLFTDSIQSIICLIWWFFAFFKIILFVWLLRGKGNRLESKGVFGNWF